MATRTLGLLAALVLVAGCGGGKARHGRAPAAPAAAPTSPGSSLEQFVTSAGRGDPAGMWALLSRSTRRRLGPTLEQFETGAAGGIERRSGVVEGSARLVFADVIGSELAVAAVTGERVRDGRRAFFAYAAPIRLERGEWRVVLDRGISIRPVRPDPGETVVGRTKLAADIVAGARVTGATLWFDGLALDGSTGSPDPKRLGIIAEAPQPLPPGRHVAVAFAASGTERAAFAWTFTVEQ